MSKLIAVWGSPDSGKTTLSVKLALALNSAGHSVIYLSPDFDSPALPVLFPGKNKSEMVSLGAVLSKTEVTADEILKNLVTIKECPDMGFLGYIDGENRYSYPKHDEAKAITLLSLLRDAAEYVIVDCNSNLKNNLLSSLAIKGADSIIRLTTATLKCLSYYSSNLPLFGDAKYRCDEHIIVMNNNDNLPYMPTEEAKAYYKNTKFKIPFSSVIRIQYASGEIVKKTSSKGFNKALSSLMKVVTANAKN